MNLPITLLTLSIAIACVKSQNSTNTTQNCHVERDQYSYANATTNLTISGFTPPGFSPRNWTINVGVHNKRDAASNSTNSQTFIWIESTAPDENLTSPDLPYEGCLISTEMVEYKAIQDQGNGGEESCKGVFSDKCYNAILEYAKSSAEHTSGVNMTRSRKGTRCLDMLQLIDESCDKKEGWEALGADYIFGNETIDNCTDPGITEGSQLRETYGMNPFGDEEGYDNFERYDRMVSKASPILMVAWLKNTTQSDEQWGDARLFCPMPNKFAEGSRVVTSGGMRMKAGGGPVWIILMVSGLIMLWLS